MVHIAILNFQCPGVTRITIPTRISPNAVSCRAVPCRALHSNLCAGSEPRVHGRSSAQRPGGSFDKPQTGAAGACSSGMMQAA